MIGMQIDASHLAKLAEPEAVGSILRRVLQDAMQAAMPDYWERRARTFEAVGSPTADETARACRNHAALLRSMELDTDIMDEIDREMTLAGFPPESNA